MSNTLVADIRDADASDTPTLNRRQAAKIRTRQKVLDAARALFAERGYDPATIRDIAREAGMSTGAVFANFQDKAELFEAVYSEELAGQAEAFRAGADQVQGSARARLISALSAGYHQMLDRLPLMQAMVARSWFQPTESDRRSKTFVGPILVVISDVLQDALRAGELRQDLDLQVLSRMIWDIYLSNFRKAAYDDFGMPELTAIIEKQIDMILGSALAK